MKKSELRENINAIKRLSAKMPKTLNEALNFNEEEEYDDIPMDEPMDEPMKQPAAAPSHGEDANIEGFIANMRKESLSIMKALADNPDDAVYQFAKKIFQLADKAHEDEKEGKDINGQPKGQMPQQPSSNM